MNGSSDPGAGGVEICLACGLCCSGVIFARLKLQPEDNVQRLSALGMPIAKSAIRARLPQPCAALDGCRCRIYAERPKYCREFECLLLQGVNAARTDPATALRVIATARERAERVRRLLRLLGDTDETLALSLRFRRAVRRVERAALDEETASLYGELTLAVHDLNLLLGEAFYPGASA